eukprot:Rmarinus@m.13801
MIDSQPSSTGLPSQVNTAELDIEESPAETKPQATPSSEDLRRVLASLRTEAVSLLMDLVRYESTQSSPECGKVQEHMKKTLSDLGMDVDMWEPDLKALKVMKGFSPPFGKWKYKKTVVGSFQPKLPSLGKSLMFNGHVDVVPVGSGKNWTSHPFKPEVREGRVYGRGAGDMKAGVVAMVMAYKAVQTLGFEPGSRLLLSTVVDEESSGNGALSVLSRGYTAEACVIPEPFPAVVVGQVGVLWATISVTGTPGHTLDTSRGTNAILDAITLWEGLLPLRDEWNSPEGRRGHHEVFRDHASPIQFNLGRIEGGEWLSSIPHRCSMGIRVGFFPGVSVREVKDAIERRLSEVAGEKNISYEISYQGFNAEGCVYGLGEGHDAPIVKAMLRAHEETTGQACGVQTLTCTTDARVFELDGRIPTTVYGPEARSIHGIDESVSIDSMMSVAAALANLIISWCGVRRIEK